MRGLRRAVYLLVAALLVARCNGADSEVQAAVDKAPKKRASVLYDGQMAKAECQDCYCLVSYTLICNTCAPLIEILVPCGTTIMDLMIAAANRWDSRNPDADKSTNPYSFTTEYRGISGQAVVGLAGVVPTDHTWQLYINGRLITLDIKHAQVTRGGDSVTFRLVPKPTQQQKRSAVAVPKPLAAPVARAVLSKVREALENAEKEATSKRQPQSSDALANQVSSDVNNLENEVSLFKETFDSLWPVSLRIGLRSTGKLRKDVRSLFVRVLKRLKEKKKV